MTTFLKRFWKAIGALLGGLAGTQVDTVTNLFGFDLPAAQDAAIAVLLAGLGALLAPKNEDPVA